MLEPSPCTSPCEGTSRHVPWIPDDLGRPLTHIPRLRRSQEDTRKCEDDDTVPEKEHDRLEGEPELVLDPDTPRLLVSSRPGPSAANRVARCGGAGWIRRREPRYPGSRGKTAGASDTLSGNGSLGGSAQMENPEAEPRVSRPKERAPQPLPG